MNTFDKIKNFCRIFRVILGLAIISAGFYFINEEQVYNLWFALGIIPFLAGITNFCPLCMITKKCTLPKKDN
jgi:hypothetical protein